MAQHALDTVFWRSGDLIPLPEPVGIAGTILSARI
jgi:hypothetical protein